MKVKQYFIIDFDSTFTKVEALDILAEISLKDDKNQNDGILRIKEVTELAMSGRLSFRESLIERIKVLKAHRDHLPELIEKLRKQVSKSFHRNGDFISSYKDSIIYSVERVQGFYCSYCGAVRNSCGKCICQ